MGFKLVRVDTVESAKIKLELGIHLFGRGILLDCNDKRVSRTHGHLEVTEESVQIKALHQNPCFIKKKSSQQVNILNKEDSASLNHGDSFGLLPSDFWYEVLLVNNIEDTDNDIHSSTNNVNNISNGDTLRVEDATLANEEEQNCDGNSEDELIDFQMDEDFEEDVSKSDRNVSNSNELESNNPETSSSNPDLKPEELGNRQENNVKDETNIPVAVKRELDVDDERADSKVPKLDNELAGSSSVDACNNNGQQNPVIKTEPEETSGTSVHAMPPSPIKPSPQPQLRERCMYGASCYRKNPQHKVDFSHPTDPDWGAGSQAPCPYGANCQKRDPRHWRDHSHPAGTTQPGPARFGPGQFNYGPSGPNLSQIMGPNGPRVVHRHGNTFYINAHTVNFFEDHFSVEDSDGDSADYDYEF